MKCFWMATLAVEPALGWANIAAGDFDCHIEPSHVVEVRSAVDGIIASVEVRRGDTIRRGQTLFELQSAAERVAVKAVRFRSQMTGQIASARNRVRYATAKLERLTELEKENFYLGAGTRRGRCRAPSGRF